jgi:predicted nucleic acid-binding protein
LKYLLDNDVFLAAIYAGHENHRAARKWLDGHKASGWGIAAETYLAAARLLMNPVVMAGGSLTAEDALCAIETELAGAHPGRIVLAPRGPESSMLERATGHRQIMDIWLVQIACDSGVRLATRDAGTLANWPDDTVAVR